MVEVLFAKYRSHKKMENFHYEVGDISIFVMFPMNWWKFGNTDKYAKLIKNILYFVS